MARRLTLDQFIVVRIHAGQPDLPSLCNPCATFRQLLKPYEFWRRFVGNSPILKPSRPWNAEYDISHVIVDCRGIGGRLQWAVTGVYSGQNEGDSS